MTVRRAAVIGTPIGHSKSPLIHRFWLAELGLPGTYDAMEVAPDDLGQLVKLLRDGELHGVNVTLPHKQAMLQHCDALTPLALAVGAVNTAYMQGDVLVGHNTDVGGFCAPLRQRAWATKTAVVIGAGGAARAVLQGCRQLGFADIHCMARTPASAATLLQSLALNPDNALAIGQPADVLRHAGLLVNATPLGMIGQPDLAIDVAQLPPGAVVNDIVYAPLETPLLRAARAAGLATVDGLAMLIGQAAEAFGYFFASPPPRDPATDARLRAMLAAC